jgi:chromosome segregation ATPase
VKQIEEFKVQLESTGNTSSGYFEELQGLREIESSLRLQVADAESSKTSALSKMEEKIISLQMLLSSSQQQTNEHARTVEDLTEEVSRLSGLLKTNLPPSASASQDMSAQENIKLFNAFEKSKEQATKTVESLTAQLGAKDAELSKLLTSVRELEDRAVRAEQIVSVSISRENQVCGDEEAMKKRINMLQTQVDLLKSEKDSYEIKLKSLESELREIRASASVNDEKLQKELEACKKTIKTLQDGRHEVSSMSEAIKAMESK